MDFFNAFTDELISFFGISRLLEAIKTGNYEPLATFDGIVSMALVVFPILLITEFILEFTRKNRKLHTFKVNFLIIIFNRVIGRLLSLSVMMWCIGTLPKYAPFTTTYTWYWFIYGYIIWELGSYIYHYFGHKVRLLWCLHSTHHASEDINLTVNHAHFFLESPYADFIRIALCMLLGVSPKLFFSILILDISYASFIHIGEKLLKNGKLGFLHKFIITPSHHRVHHAKNDLYVDTNFCNLLNIWDRIFGTYQEEQDNVPMQYGISRTIDASSFWDVYFGEFVALFKDVAKAPGFKNKLLYLVKPPGWNHTGDYKTAKMLREDFLNNNKD